MQDIKILSNNTEVKLINMLNSTEQNRYHNIIKNVITEYQTKTQEYKKNIKSNMQIIAGFKCNLNKLAEDNYTAKNMYVQLYAAVYKQIRKDCNKYYDFLREIQDPIAYTQKQSKQTKPTEYTLDNGNYLPPIEIQKYDDKPRYRKPKEIR